MDFQLTIRLGNDTMQTARDLAEALRDAAQIVESYYNGLSKDGLHSIRDVNGNTVGQWQVTGGEDQETNAYMIRKIARSFTCGFFVDDLILKLPSSISRASIDQELKRMVDGHDLTRAARGFYLPCYPRLLP